MTEPRPAWLTPDVQGYLAQVAYEFQVRSFGEQLARINALPFPARQAAYRDMMQHGQDHGVELERPERGVKA